MCSETFSICLNMSVKLRMTLFSCKINNFWLNLSNINRYIFSSFAFVWKSNFKCVKYTPVIMELPFFMGITLVDVHLKWLNWFHFLILEGALLAILIYCMICLSPFPYIKRMPMPTVFFPHTARPWNSLPIDCFPLIYDLKGFKSRIIRHILSVGSF